MTTTPQDLTRWNRAGLRSVQYVDGNAAVYLDELRKKLAERFGDRWPAIRAGEDIAATETDWQLAQYARNQHLLTQYEGQRGDIGWEIVRALARACHVLTGHIDAYANEAYIGTATQWEFLRRLAEMIDYHPAPATSATTFLVIEAKPGKSGAVEKGFQVRYTPPTGGPQVIFETLEDVQISEALNGRRPKDRERSESSLVGDGGARSPWRAPRKPNVTTGQVALLVNDDAENVKDPLPFRIEAVDDKTDLITLADLPDLSDWRKGYCRLLVAPRWNRKPWLNGSDVIRTLKPHGLNKGSYVAWQGDQQDDPQAWHFAEVKEADDRGLRLRLGDGVLLPGVGTYLYEAYPVEKDLPIPADFTVLGVMTGDVTSVPETMADLMHRIKGAEGLFPEIQIPEGSSGGLDINFMIALGFMFPSPQLPPELAKLAIMALLAKGEMKIPSTQEQVFAFFDLAGISDLVSGLSGDGLEQLAEYIRGLPNANPSVPDLEAVKSALKFGALQFRVSDFEDLDTLVVKLWRAYKSKDDPSQESAQYAISQFLTRTKFSSPSKKLLDEYDGSGTPSDQLKLALIVELNKLIGEEGFPLYDEQLFKNVLLSKETQGLIKLINQNPQEKGEKLASLKRLLFEDAYPEHFRSEVPPEDLALFRNIVDASDQPPLLVPKDATEKAVVGQQEPRYMFDGNGDALSPRDRVIGDFASGLKATKIREINLDPSQAQRFSITFDPAIKNQEEDEPEELKTLYADFRGELKPKAADVNETPVNNPSAFEPLPDQLINRQVVVVSEDGSATSHVTTVKKKGDTIVFDPALPKGFTKANAILHGNVVLAGHGAVKPDKVLSSGPAPAANQSLLLDIEQVSSIEDPTHPRGTRPAIQVSIDGEIWRQVIRFDESKPTDPHYTVRATEEGHLRLIFGDGWRGRRLPAGVNNVRVRHRAGAGRSGNDLPAGSLQSPVHPHPWVAAVDQPLRTVGGEDMERPEHLREQAPATLLTMGRAVSLSDFEHLAENRLNVWHARAFRRPGGGGYDELVEVVVVPAGGGKVEPIREKLTEFLHGHSVPTVRVVVEDYKQGPVGLDVELRVDHGRFTADQVVASVQDALLDRFSIERRGIGQTLYLSEIYEVVETHVPGVENATCIFKISQSADDGQTAVPQPADEGETMVPEPTNNGQTIVPRPEQVLFLDPIQIDINETAYKP